MTEKKLLDRARDLIRVKHYSIWTEQPYLQCTKQGCISWNVCVCEPETSTSANI
jgi:hypothetical protein